MLRRTIMRYETNDDQAISVGTLGQSPETLRQDVRNGPTQRPYQPFVNTC
jgi:hypothetical protein